MELALLDPNASALLDDSSDAYSIVITQTLQRSLRSAALELGDYGRFHQVKKALAVGRSASIIKLVHELQDSNGLLPVKHFYFLLLEAKIRQHVQLQYELVATVAFNQHCVAMEAIDHPFDEDINERGYFLNDLRWALLNEEACDDEDEAAAA
eukprot:TRINITY_DN6925_c0_g1_i1.p3 TRINITY_DN6925_c0_g1~~TRINITY_DN6925_c0_g1_i1.p3  ORF type:complete len:153 (+),score=39.36 TRINITY_DN6925_c0_g1_i1:2212-2670(+)